MANTPDNCMRLGAYGKSEPALSPQDLGFSCGAQTSRQEKVGSGSAHHRPGSMQAKLVLRAQLHLPLPHPFPNPHLAAWTCPRMLTAQVCRFTLGFFFLPHELRDKKTKHRSNFADRQLWVEAMPRVPPPGK